jgi:hypothetical protein
MNPLVRATILLVLLLWLTPIPSLANVCGIFFQFYCQEFDQTGTAYASQNDFVQYGLYAQVYDNFTSTVERLTQIRFEGEYFNPPTQGPITGWTVGLYGDNGGQPGGLLFTQHTDGTGNETFDGYFGGFPTYVYTLDINYWQVNFNTQYWISVYPDLGFPPQWGWSTGSGGDGISYQDFFGTRSPLSADMAFAIAGHRGCAAPDSCLPEPSTLLMVGTGAAGAGAFGGEILGVSLLGLLRSLFRRVPLKTLLVLAACALTLAGSSSASLIYQQPFGFTGNSYASQDDTNGLGLYAQVYDNFTLRSSANVMYVQFTGQYFNPPQQGPITGWTVIFYSDAHGQPGSPLNTTHVSGTGGETFIGTYGGFPTYTYLINANTIFWAQAGTQYWLDVYPDLGFPPQWGWASGLAPDGTAFQDFFGTRSKVAAGLAFGLGGGCDCEALTSEDALATSEAVTPEPASLLMATTAAVGAGAFFRTGFGLSLLGILKAARRRPVKRAVTG